MGCQALLVDLHEERNGQIVHERKGLLFSWPKTTGQPGLGVVIGLEPHV